MHINGSESSIGLGRHFKQNWLSNESDYSSDMIIAWLAITLFGTTT